MGPSSVDGSSVTIGRTGVTTTINGTLALANDLIVSNGGTSSFVPPSAFFSGYPTAGYNYLAFLQYSTSADTITWYSTGESASFAAGISGEVWG